MKNINNGFTVLNTSLLASSYYLPICVTFSQHFIMKNFKVGSKAVRLLYTHQLMYHELYYTWFINKCVLQTRTFNKPQKAVVFCFSFIQKSKLSTEVINSRSKFKIRVFFFFFFNIHYTLFQHFTLNCKRQSSEIRIAFDHNHI